MRDLAKLAYETYCTAVGWESVRGEKLPDWEDQSEKLKEAWKLAASAVFTESHCESR